MSGVYRVGGKIIVDSSEGVLGLCCGSDDTMMKVELLVSSWLLWSSK